MTSRPPSRSAAGSASPLIRPGSSARPARVRSHASTAAWVASATQQSREQWARERGPSRINPFSHRTQPFTPEQAAIEEARDTEEASRMQQQQHQEEESKQQSIDDTSAASAVDARPIGDAESTSAASAALAASGGLILPAAAPTRTAARPPSPTLSEVVARSLALRERLGGSRALDAAQSAVEESVQFRRLEEQARREDAQRLSHPWVRLQGNRETEAQYAPPVREQAHPLWGVPRPESRIVAGSATAASSRAPSALSPPRKTPSSSGSFLSTNAAVPPESQLDELQDAEGDGWLLRAMHAQKSAFESHLAPDLSLKLSRLSGEYNTRIPQETFLAAIEGHNMTRAAREYDPLRPEASLPLESAAHAALKAGRHYSRPTTSEGLRSTLGSRSHTRPSTSQRQQAHAQTPGKSAVAAKSAAVVSESKEQPSSPTAAQAPAAAPFVPSLPVSHLSSTSSAAPSTAAISDPSDPGFIDPAFADEKLLTMTKAKRKAARRELKALRRAASASTEPAPSTAPASAVFTATPAVVQHFPHPPVAPSAAATLRSADARLVSSIFDDESDTEEKTAPHSQRGSQLSSAAGSPRPPLSRSFSPGRSILRHRTFLVAAGAVPAASAAASGDVAGASATVAEVAASEAADVLSHPPSPTDRIHSVSWVHPLPRAPDASLTTTAAAAAEAHKRALEQQAAEALRPPSPPTPPPTVEERAAAKGFTAASASKKPHPPKAKSKQKTAKEAEQDSNEQQKQADEEPRGAQTDRPRTAVESSTARSASSQQRRRSSGYATSRPASSSRATGSNRSYVLRAGSRFAFSPAPIGPLSSFGYSERSCSAAGHTSQCIEVELQSGSGGSSAVPIDVMARPRSVAQSAHLLSHGGGCAVKYKSAKISGQRDVLASVISDTLATGQVRQMAVRHFRRSVELITSNKAIKGVAALLEGSTSAGSSLALMRQKAAAKRAANAAGALGSNPGIADLTSAATQLREASAGVALTSRSYLSKRSSSAAAAGEEGSTSAGPASLGGEVRIPARYTRILGTDVAATPGALSFGEPRSTPFRPIASSSMGGTGGMGAAFRDARPECFDAAKYVGPGLYHPSHALQSPRVPDSVQYGPPHSISVAITVALGASALIPADRDPQGPGVHRPNHAATAAQGKALHGSVLFASTSGRGEGMAWRGIAPDLANPGPKYDPAKHSRLWSDQLKHRYCEHGFGSGERFADTASMQPPSSGHAHSYLSSHPEKLLDLCGPRQGPGTLHTIIPSRTAHGRFPYDPNLGSYLESKHIVPLEEVGRYLSREEMGEGSSSNAAGGDAGGNGVPAHTRMMSTGGGGGSGGDGTARGGGGAGQGEERITRDMEALLAAALASAPLTTVGPTGPGGSRTFVPVQAPTRGPNMPATATASEEAGGDGAAAGATTEEGAATAATEPPHYRDPHALPPPSQYELRARAALFAPPRRASYSPVRAPSSRRPNTGHIRPTGVGLAEEDVTKRNKILARASHAGPEARHTKHDAALATSAAHREEVLARAARIHQSKIERLRQKMALADAQDSEGDGGRLWQQRWLVLMVLSRRAAWMKALLLFSRRMRSPAHLQARAARKIQRFWRAWFLARQTARRAQAVATINRALGVFRIQLRIRHKRHAARVLALFFKDLAANNYAPPLQMQLKETAAAAAGAISGKDESALLALRAQRGRKAAQARFVARMKKRQGDRTLVGLIRHFKDQVLVIQRAWRAHLLLREFSIDMHALAWDRVVTEHFHALYRKQTSGLNATTLAANAAAALVGVGSGSNGATAGAASQLYRSSSIAKPPEQSAAFKAQRALIKAAAEAKAEEAEREARQRADEIKFGIPYIAPTLAKEPSSSSALPGSNPTLVKQSSSRPGSTGMPASAASIAAASSSALPPVSPVASPSLSHRSLSPPPARVPKPLVLKLDCRFTVAEKRAILLMALRLRKLRFLRVKAHYESQIGAWVADQNQGISAARRLLECPPPVSATAGAAGHRRQLTASRFTPAFFAAKFTRIHPPPYLPRLMSGRQMIQLINAAAQAKRESKSRRQQQQRGGALAAAAAGGAAGEDRASSKDADDVGRSVKQLFHSGPAAPSGSGAAKLPSPVGSPPRSLNASPRASVSNLQRMGSGTGLTSATGSEPASMLARTPSLARAPSMVRAPSLVRQHSKLGSGSKPQHGSPRISPRGSIIGSGAGSGGGSPSRGIEGESVEVRLRYALLRNWAAQLPIPTRRLRSSATIAVEEEQTTAQPAPSIIVSPSSGATAVSSVPPPHARQSSRGSHHSSSSFSAIAGHSRRQSSFDRSGGAIALAELLREAAELEDFAAEDDPNDAEIQVPAQLEQLKEEDE